jgi:hypothetical protein
MQTALTEAALQMPDSSAKDATQRRVFANQLAADPENSHQYIADVLARSAQQSPQAQAAMARSLGQTWATVDAQNASQFLTSLPQGGPKDNLARGLAESLAWDDPVSAMTWAKNIQQTETRQQALQAVFKAYETTNPAAAEAAKQGLTASDALWLNANSATPAP